MINLTYYGKHGIGLAFVWWQIHLNSPDCYEDLMTFVKMT